MQTEATSALLGYDCEKVDRTNQFGEDVAYRCWGGRGAIYELCRYRKTPHLMFVRNVRRYGHIVGLKGNYTFTDESGELHPTEMWRYA